MFDRSRTEVEVQPTNGTHSQYKNGSHIGPPKTTLMSAKSSTMEDMVTKDFALRLKRGEIINNPASMAVPETLNTSGYLFQTNGSTFYEVKGTGSVTDWYIQIGLGPSSLPPELTLSAGTEQEARQSAVANLDSTPYSFAEDLGEIRETLLFLRNPIKAWLKVGKLYRQAVRRKRRLNGRIVLSYAKASASVWNEYRFAAAPLVRSILSLYEAQMDALTFRPERRTSRGIRDYSNSDTQDIVRFYGSDNNVYRYERRIDQVSRAGIIYDVDNPVFDVFFKYGLRIKDIPTTLWELLPLSFMVDRVVNIKDSIRGIINLNDPKLSTVAGFLVNKVTVETKLTLIQVNQAGWTTSLSPQDTLHSRIFTYGREVWDPGLIDVVPRFTPGNLVSTATKVVDLLAIGVSLYQPGKKT